MTVSSAKLKPAMTSVSAKKTPVVEPNQGAFNHGVMSARVGFRVRMLADLLAARTVEAFAPFGLRHGAFTTMVLVSVNPQCSQIDLAREAGIDKSALVAIIDELETLGLATRRRSGMDRRRSMLALTAKGEKLVKEMAKLSIESERPLREAFAEDELAQLFEYLERAYQAVLADNQRKSKV